MNNVKITKNVPTTIFELPEVKRLVDELLEPIDEEIRAKFDEMKNYIIRNEKDRERYGEISYEEVKEHLKFFLYRDVLNEAVEMALTDKNKYYTTIEHNVKEALSKPGLENRILEKQIVIAFEKAISRLPVQGGLDACLHGGTMLLLDSKFLTEG